MGRCLIGGLLLVATLFLPAGPVAAEGDAARGERVFRRCASCHEVERDRNRNGPHLIGLFGRGAGAVEEFSYSVAMLDSGIVWDAESLDGYLENPRGYMPGTRMNFAGLRRLRDREDVIAYLKEATAAD